MYDILLKGILFHSFQIVDLWEEGRERKRNFASRDIFRIFEWTKIRKKNNWGDEWFAEYIFPRGVKKSVDGRCSVLGMVSYIRNWNLSLFGNGAWRRLSSGRYWRKRSAQIGRIRLIESLSLSIPLFLSFSLSLSIPLFLSSLSLSLHPSFSLFSSLFLPFSLYLSPFLSLSFSFSPSIFLIISLSLSIYPTLFPSLRPSFCLCVSLFSSISLPWFHCESAQPLSSPLFSSGNTFPWTVQRKRMPIHLSTQELWLHCLIGWAVALIDFVFMENIFNPHIDIINIKKASGCFLVFIFNYLNTREKTIRWIYRKINKFSAVLIQKKNVAIFFFFVQNEFYFS